MMTEQEAKTKACCRTLCADIWSNPKDNEGECRTATTPCIASACMAWRWQPTHINNPDDPNGDMIWSARTYGFCGLAGDSPPLPVSAPR